MTEHDSPTEWVERLDYWGRRVIALVLLFALVFTMVNVQQFAVSNEPGSKWWWAIAWLLDPMATITAATAIVFEVVLAQHDKPRVGWLTATKWYALGCTWAMNIWSSVAAHNLAGILLHSVAPGLVFLVAESAPRVWTHIAEITADATTADPVPASPIPEQQPWRPLPTQPPVPSSFTSPIRSALHPVTHPNGQVTATVTAPTQVEVDPPAVTTPVDPPNDGPTISEDLVRRATAWAAGQRYSGWRTLQTQFGLSQSAAKELAKRINPPKPTTQPKVTRQLERVS